MHYSAGSEISTPAGGGIQTGRRTGGLDGNDVSQFRQIYECNPEFADTPTAIALVAGYACPAGATLKSDSTDVQLCAAAARAANCSVIQFSSPECKCCDKPVDAVVTSGSTLYQVALGAAPPAPPRPSPPSPPPSPPSAPCTPGKVAISTKRYGPDISWKIDDTHTIRFLSVISHLPPTQSILVTFPLPAALSSPPLL